MAGWCNMRANRKTQAGKAAAGRHAEVSLRNSAEPRREKQSRQQEAWFDDDLDDLDPDDLVETDLPDRLLSSDARRRIEELREEIELRRAIGDGFDDY